LSASKGLTLGDPNDSRRTLLANPIVAEKTAEEANFALAVETWLDVIEDPASREVVVELLMALNVEAKSEQIWDLSAIVRWVAGVTLWFLESWLTIFTCSSVSSGAIEAHWHTWARTFVTDGGSTDVQDHYRLATRIFEDLPDDEAANYLQEAALGVK
jgi:hypothetical protein